MKNIHLIAALLTTTVITFIGYSVKAQTTHLTFTVSQPALPQVTLGNDTAICEGTTLMLNAGNIGSTYFWNDNTTNQQLPVTAVGTYSVTVTNAGGCSTTDTIVIQTNPLPTVNIGSDSAFCLENDITIHAGLFNAYTWSNNSHNESITINSSGNYTVTVTDANGCHGISNTVHITVHTPYDNQELCIVTVDSTSTKNLIVWEKPVTAEIDSFKIYREIASVYTHIASIPYSAMSVFTDTTNGVTPSTTSYKYEISVVDTCGNESTLSSFHRTIHVAISPAAPCGYNLLWNDYIGFPVTQYLIYRDSCNTGWVKMDSVSFGNTSWTDFICYSSNDTIAYLVEAINPAGCDPTFIKAGGHNSSRSNVQRNFGILTIPFSSNNLNLKISPNPTSGKVTVDLSVLKPTVTTCQLSITNLQGELIYKTTLTNSKTELDLSDKASGIYFISVKSGEKVYHQKLVKE